MWLQPGLLMWGQTAKPPPLPRKCKLTEREIGLKALAAKFHAQSHTVSVFKAISHARLTFIAQKQSLAWARCQSDPCPSVQEETSPAEWMSGSSQFTLLDSLHTHIITLLKLLPQLFLLLPRDRPRQRARNLPSFKKQVVAA